MRVLPRITCPATSDTQGPAALTRVRARIVRVAPVFSSRVVSVQAPSSRDADTQPVRVATVAPSSAAAIAFSTTRRESSTQQSEYSKPRLNSGFSDWPIGSSRSDTVRVGGSFLRPPMLS